MVDAFQGQRFYNQVYICVKYIYVMAHLQNHVILYCGPIMEGQLFSIWMYLTKFTGLTLRKIDCNCLGYL